MPIKVIRKKDGKHVATVKRKPKVRVRRKRRSKRLPNSRNMA